MMSFWCRPLPAVVLCVAGATMGASFAAQGTPVTATTPRFGGNPEAARIVNPVPATPESIAAGRRSYQRLCVRCHGFEGKGDGGGAGAGGQPADLTDAVWDFGGSDGEIFTVLRDGTSADMESYAERLPETDLWHLVNFVRTLGPAAAPQGAAQVPPASVPRPVMHHVHLNVVDPERSADFYTRWFGVTRKTDVAGYPGVQSEENMYVLFNRVDAPARAELETAIWHFGWGSTDMPADFARLEAAGAPWVTPLSTLRGGTIFAYLRAPDGNLVELNSASHNGFVHVHLYSDAPLCAGLWYERVLGATGRTQETVTGDCNVPYGEPSEPLAVIRSPAAFVRLGDIQLIIYPRQTSRPLVAGRRYVNDHIAVSYPDVTAAVARLRTLGVRVLQDVHEFGTSGGTAALIEGPDGIAIELVEQPVAGGRRIGSIQAPRRAPPGAGPATAAEPLHEERS